MLNLAATTDTVEMITSAAGTIHYSVSWVDVVGSTGAWVDANRQAAVVSGAATTTIVAALGSASNRRNVKHVNIRNAHATTANDITVQLNLNGTIVTLFKATLQAGEALEFTEEFGWFVAQNIASALDQNAKLTADLASFAVTTLADITGLTFAVLNGSYYHFRAHILHQAAATTTGIALGVTLPTVTQFAAVVYAPVSTAADGTANIFFGHLTSSGDSVIGTGTPAANTTHLAVIEGSLLAGADGTVQIRGASEVGASSVVTVKQGSNVRATRLP